MAVENLLVPGKTCQRIETADKLRIILEGRDYFRAVKEAMLSAEKTIMMIGWDFDTRIEFEPDKQTLDGPNQLGEFLSWITNERERLQLYMLKWNIGAVQSVLRGMVPIGVRPVRFNSNFHFQLDSTHPVGAAHHSKIIVIDDQIAFCGGIDMTAGRWDTCEHLDDQPCRTLPGESEMPKPWHDATVAVSGDIACALGDVARERWLRSTAEKLPPPKCDNDPVWPDLELTWSNVPVALARTFPGFSDFDEVREIEALYLEAIARAQDTLYIESQYLASAKLVHAMAERLQEEDGPEIVLVLPRNADGWLRQKAMDGARVRMLEHLWAHDPHDRFAAYYPVTTSEAPIYVHAKILILDDELIRVGSSNLNNRSMGFDTETDLAVEASQCDAPDEIRASISNLRAHLVSEHLNVSKDELADALEASGGSLIGAITALKGDGRSLRLFEEAEVNGEANILAENEFADPEEVGDGLAERLVNGIRDLVGNASE
ncbi:phospholipase D-like domain-containing protein [Henriciella algicola]|uniref:Phospholipase D n=1 Tax=Henriciella algicola TaxID=1608422 RepID=A0A399RP98_9PROT|nr:phospholipase D-like domain-containing protein [Henriciella algicola]RIJ32143.1 phospholipase [Henriciella algicola]